MGSWQKRARLGVAVVGVVTAGVVYLAMRERPEAAAPAAVVRVDPKSVVEVEGAALQGITGVEKNFQISFKSSQSYADGSTKFVDGVTIVVKKSDNRTFTVRSTEALTDKDRVSIELIGAVRLEDSDGFFLTTDRATYDRAKSTARTTGAVAFGKGRMSGTGVGITYDQANNVLQVADQAQVTTRDEAGMPVMEFTGGAATLDRTQHRLTVEETVHVVRSEQVIDADRAVASLSANDDVIQFLELRGNARVQGGGGGIDAMSARDINLDYTDDGVRLEAVALTGTAAVARAGQNGAGDQMVGEMIDIQLAEDGANHIRLKGNGAITMIGEQGKDGRRIAGQSLDLNVAKDGTLTRAIGREDVRLDFPAAADSPKRSIRANSLDGTGQAGKGLTDTTFDGNVVFTEEERTPATAKGTATATRTARSQRLHASLANDAVTSATFTIDVTFEETGLKACAGRVDYQPEKGALALSGVTAGGKPIVAEEQAAIEADAIDVTLDTRRMQGKGNVTMQVRTANRCKPAAARAAASQGPNRMPGLLKQDAGATIRAGSLDYEGDAGRALFSGRALMSQGDTSITGDTLELDQSKGDMVATGNAISTMAMDGAQSTGRAHQIRYIDAERVIRYAAAPPPPPGTVPPPAPVAPAVPGARGRGAATPANEPQLSVPQGELRADGNIDLVLAEGGGKAERIEARTNVRMQQPGQRTASDAATLTYHADEQKYVMTAGATAPVKLVADCREFRGKTLTFYGTDDRISIDGQDVRRTQTTKVTGPCQPPAPR
jgi:LPS export ABC transporter protein LptC